MSTAFPHQNNAQRLRLPVRCASLLAIAIAASSAYGQEAKPAMNGMDHRAMDHGSMNHRAPSGTENRGTPSQSAPSDRSAPPRDSVDQGGMDHGLMNHDAMSAPPSRQSPQFTPQQTAPVGNPTEQVPQYAPEGNPRPYPKGAMGGVAMAGTDMAMADNDVFSLVRFDQLEYVRSSDDRGFAWDVDGWIGKDYNKFWLKTEGERVAGESDGRVEALWSHAVAAFWDVQTGIRHDFGAGPNRQWLAMGFQGIAPYWFDIEAFAYVGPAGRTAARAKAEYNIRITQRAFLSPEIEASAYGKSDRERGIGSGLSDIEAGLRFRYEIQREVAPYIGVTWGRKLGETADFAREAGESRTERRVVAGVRIWF